VIVLALVAAACTAEPRPQLPGSLEVIGHEPLFDRGMNAGLALWGDFAYVGSRTDGSAGHLRPGVLVVDVEDRADPHVVGEIGPPHQGGPGETSRELRVWPGRGMLVVLSFACESFLHACAPEPAPSTFRFYDIAGAHAALPRFVSAYEPPGQPHEFYLWQDPTDPHRALLFVSTPAPVGENLLVVDVSGAPGGEFREIATWSAAFPDPGLDDALHSLSVSANGRRAYLAHLTAGFLILDTSEVAREADRPTIRAVTPLEQRARWPGWGRTAPSRFRDETSCSRPTRSTVVRRGAGARGAGPASSTWPGRPPRR